jgi:hypothetical protein
VRLSKWCRIRGRQRRIGVEGGDGGEWPGGRCAARAGIGEVRPKVRPADGDVTIISFALQNVLEVQIGHAAGTPQKSALPLTHFFLSCLWTSRAP